MTIAFCEYKKIVYICGMENAQLNTKQDLILSIAKIGNEITVNQFVDIAHGAFIDSQLTSEEFISIMNQALAHVKSIKTGS